jgi:ubiquinone/menaquinone biosynthesis C-methylase UbiE
MPIEQTHEKRKKQGLECGGYKWNWEQRAWNLEEALFPLTRIYEAIKNESSGMKNVLDKIGAESIPVMDISSSTNFGLVSFIAKMNPQIPCMATDIDANDIKCLRIFLDRDLPEYNISLACFDNYCMPIKDNSLYCITSTLGMSDICSENSLNDFTDFTLGKEKPIGEVYRVLKPSGCYVTIERRQEWKFDLAKVRESYNKYGKLFGIYTYDEIEEAQNKLKAPTWREKFIEAGFQVEIEEKYPKKAERNELTEQLCSTSQILKFHEWTDEEKKEYNILRNKKEFDESEKDCGIEFSGGENFYVLRKPD